MTAPLCKTVSLGLQGAGTYGADTWGVLDRLAGSWTLEYSPVSHLLAMGAARPGIGRAAHA